MTSVNIVFLVKSSNSKKKNMGILRNSKTSIFNLGGITKRSIIYTCKRGIHLSTPKIQANGLKIIVISLKSVYMA